MTACRGVLLINLALIQFCSNCIKARFKKDFTGISVTNNLAPRNLHMPHNEASDEREPSAPLDWKCYFTQLPLLTRLIRSQLDDLRLDKDYTVEDIKHDLFIEVQKSVNDKRLDCQVIEDEEVIECKLLLTRIEQDGTKVPIKNLLGYLRVTVYNHLLKKNIKKNRLGAHDGVNIENLPQQTGSPLDHAQTQELRSKIQQLEPEDALILELFWFEDLSMKQIAERLVSEGFSCYSESNLRKKQQRAREKLRSIY